MAQNVTRSSRKSQLKYSALALTGLLLTATTTQAGFEWIPAEPQKPANPPAQVETVAPTGVSAMPEAVDGPHAGSEILSPLPVESHANSPMLPPPAIEAPVPQAPVTTEPVIKVQRMSPPVQAPAKAPMAEPAVKHMHVELPPPPMPQALEPMDTSPEGPGTLSAEMPPETLNAPTIHIVMPQDAPNSAIETLPQSALVQPPPAQRPLPDLPQAPVAAPIIAPPMAPAPLPVATDMEQEVVGFGSDMPLALALQEIAPAGYAFSFGENINPGSKVSWSGGKSWTSVMQDMIAPLGLQASVRGKAIFIHHQHHTSMAQEQAMMAPEQIAPAAGDPAEEDISKEMTPVSVRRNIIKDPGMDAHEQPEETLSSIEDIAVKEPEQPTKPLQVQSPRKPRYSQIWEAEKGDSLKQTLSSWSKDGHFELEWNAMHDYMLESDILVAGRLDNAIKALLENGINAENSPLLTFVESPSGEKSSKVIIEDKS